MQLPTHFHALAECKSSREAIRLICSKGLGKDTAGGWTIAQLAHRLGVSERAVSNWRAGEPISALSSNLILDLISKGLSPSEREGLEQVWWNLVESSKDHSAAEPRLEPAQVSYRLGRIRDFLERNSDAHLFRSVAMLEEMRVSSPPSADLYSLLALAKWRQYFFGWEADQSALDESIKCANLALSLDSNSASAMNAVLRASWDLGKTIEAFRTVMEFCAKSEPTEEACLLMARALHNVGRSEKAIKLCEPIISRTPFGMSAHKMTCWSHTLLAQHRDAIDCYATYRIENPFDSNIVYPYALSLVGDGQPDRAEAVINEAVQTYDAPFTYTFLLSSLYRYLGGERVDDAYVINIARNGPNASEYRSNMRLRAWYLGPFAAAGQQEVVEQFVDSYDAGSSRNGYITYRVSELFRLLGDCEQYLKYLENATQLGFVSPKLISLELSLEPDAQIRTAGMQIVAEQERISMNAFEATSHVFELYVHYVTSLRT